MSLRGATLRSSEQRGNLMLYRAACQAAH